MSLEAEVRVTVGEFVEEVALEVDDGEVVAVLGPNGSGKSTLLRTLAGLQALEVGRISLDGEVWDDPATRILCPPERRSCGVVFQDYLLFPHLSVLANVAFGLRRRGIAKVEAEREAHEWLSRAGLGALVDARPGKLSGGEAQQVALARALVPRPKLLLLDEPLAALDVSTRGGVRHRLRRHLDEFSGSCVLVTHDPLDVAALADRVVVLEHGRVVQSGLLSEVLARPEVPYVAALAGRNLLAGQGGGSGAQVDLGEGVVLTAGQPVTGPCWVSVARTDVSLHLERPSSAAAAIWSTRVAAIDLLVDRALVALERPGGMSAEITTTELAELRLTEGAEVWASIEPHCIEVFADG